MIPTATIKKILYATDLSESARHAFSYALTLSRTFGAKIVFLHVLPEKDQVLLSRSLIGYIGQDKWDAFKKEEEAEAKNALIGKRRDHLVVKEVLGHFSKKSRGGEQTGDEIVVKRGDEVEQILAQAKESQCDIIVMGTHGHKTLAEAMLGSTARKVLDKSDIPVLVVKPPEKK